VTNVDYLLL